MAIDPELMKQIEQPLTEEHQTSLQDSIDLGAALQPLIMKAKNAGIPIGTVEDDIKEQVDRAVNIRNEFFPGAGY